MRAEVALLLPLLATSPAAQDAVVIGSKNFTEARVLGELLAATLAAHTDLQVEHRANLGGTKVCFDALRAGEIDVYVEYTGTAWAVLIGEDEPSADALRVFLRVHEVLGRDHDLELLPPLGFQNSYALAMTEARAAELGVTSIGDLARVAGELEGAFSAEFTNREDGYPGLSAHYGFELGRVRTLEHGLAYPALAAGETDLVDAYTTDGKLARYPLRVLVDDRGFFPPYHAVPLARRDFLSAHPEAEAALRRLAFAIDEEAMIAMNFAVEEEGRTFGAVARAFLADAGLLDAPAEAGAARAEDGLAAFLWARRGDTAGHLATHLWLTGLSVLLAALVAVPLGLAAARWRRVERVALGVAGVLQTVPSLALLALLIPLPLLGLSARSAVFALFLYALLPILRNTATGLRSVDPELLDAARGLGLTPRQVLLRVQLPLASRAILAGVRTATVIGIGVATLAAFIGAGGLGEPIVTGLYLNDTRLVLSGALPAALLALVADHLLGRVERALTPRGVRVAEAAATAGS